MTIKDIIDAERWTECGDCRMFEGRYEHNASLNRVHVALEAMLPGLEAKVKAYETAVDPCQLCKHYGSPRNSHPCYSCKLMGCGDKNLWEMKK